MFFDRPVRVPKGRPFRVSRDKKGSGLAGHPVFSTDREVVVWSTWMRHICGYKTKSDPPYWAGKLSGKRAGNNIEMAFRKSSRPSADCAVKSRLAWQTRDFQVASIRKHFVTDAGMGADKWRARDLGNLPLQWFCSPSRFSEDVWAGASLTAAADGDFNLSACQRRCRWAAYLQ